MLRESLKMYFRMAANEGFGLRSIDISVVFLQVKGLERKGYMEAPRDKEGR